MSNDSKKRNEIESEVYDEFLSTEVSWHQEYKMAKDNSINNICGCSMASLKKNMELIQKYNTEKRNLSKALNTISHKPQLNMESGCPFVIP